jgi:hypothetical protein
MFFVKTGTIQFFWIVEVIYGLAYHHNNDDRASTFP